MRYLPLLIAAAILCGCSTYGRPVSLTPRIAATVKVNVDCGPMTAFGSGIAIDGKHIITAAHVVEACGQAKAAAVAAGIVSADGWQQKLTAEFRSGERFEVCANKIDHEHDLARLVQCAAAGAEPIVEFDAGKMPLGEADSLRAGRGVYLITGAPDRGVEAGNVVEDPDGWFFWHNARTEAGNSGSGIFDSQGRLVGITTHARHKDGQFVRGRATEIWSRKEWLFE